ncbi:MAG TPA: nitroreductase [Puia sp.]|nr:nitroreductase [Puia sp.]
MEQIAEPIEKSHTTDLISCINERRAVRRYADRPVNPGLVASVIDAGKMAPSAMNRQPWRFYVLNTPGTIRVFSIQIASKLEGQFHLAHGQNPETTDDPIFHGAPVVIFLTGPREDEWAPMDIGMCAQNMMLAAQALGLATCPIGLARFVEKTKVVASLPLAPTEKVMLAISLGYGLETPAPHPRVADNVVFIG